MPLRLIQSGPPNIHQWAGIINQLRASNCGIQRFGSLLKLWNSEVQKSPQIVKFRNRGHRLPRRSLRGQKRSSGQCYISLTQIFIIVENHPPCIIVILHCNISLLNLNPDATFHVLFFRGKPPAKICWITFTSIWTWSRPPTSDWDTRTTQTKR